jgi:hypothetical protein
MTEEIIKKSVIQYLKTYYKYRPRFQHDETLAPTLAQTDLMTANGIFADGHLSFLDEKGRQFVATFEASSADTAYEVKYRLEKNLLFWDAIAVSALATAFLFSYFYAFKYSILNTTNGGLIFAVVVLFFLIINILYRFGFKSLARYRSIFAVEQFKQYFADEQWVAIGNDTFSDQEDDFFQELKKQCVYNGFGLLSLDDDHDVQLLITPSRELVYGKARSKVAFFSTLLENNYTQRAVNWTTETGQKLFRPTTERGLLRFHRPYYYQYFLTFLSATLFAIPMGRLVNDTFYAKEGDQKNPEKSFVTTEDTFLESNNIGDSLHVRPFNDKRKNGDLAKVDEPMPAVVPNDFTTKGEAEDGVYMMAENGDLNFYDCERLQLEGGNYVIMDSKQADFSTAKKKMAILKSKGVMTNCVWLGCFTKSDMSYVVFHDLIYNDKKEASKKAAEIYKMLKSKDIDASKVKVISLTNDDN